MLKKMPFILIALMILIGLLHSFMPLSLQALLYGMSLSIKSLIVFCLPLIIFSLIFKTTTGLANNASKLIFSLLIAVCLSNFISTMLSYSVGHFVYQCDLATPFPTTGADLQPLYALCLPRWIGNDMAMLAGLCLGLLLSQIKPLLAKTLAAPLDALTRWLLKSFLYLVPLFIAGFVVKMCHDQVMTLIIKSYGPIFGLTTCSLFAYIGLLYFLSSRRSPYSWIQSLKNMAPAALTGFGSMSSAAAMPLTLIGTEKNASHPEVARSIIPATVNIHLIGDCFAIPIFAFTILKSFGIAEPSFLNYLLFAGYFVLAKFSVAAVPGGGIIVMLPILERYLGFDPVMLSLITALYILFDPIITSANVLGNGGFAMGMSRVLTHGKKTDNPVA